MVRAAWDDILKAAEQYNALGACTAFIGFGLMDIANIAGRQPKDKSIGHRPGGDLSHRGVDTSVWETG